MLRRLLHNWVLLGLGILLLSYGLSRLAINLAQAQRATRPDVIAQAEETAYAEAAYAETSRNGYPKGPVIPGGRVPELMARYPNLCGDLSAGSGYNAISRDPEFGYTFMEEFQDRLYWATDIANDPRKMPIVDYFRKLKAEKLISAAAYEKITWRNADRLLKLGLGS